MSEENTQPAETAESQAGPVEVPQLGVADLKLMANILEVVGNRGAIKAGEMAAVGQLYNNLMTFLIANGAVEMPQPEVEDAGELPEGDES